ncbi:MAG: DUF4099 domain-containing protein [Clostridium sp.]|nr:DUF4099 domain-containing protein [Clostridium sp.]
MYRIEDICWQDLESVNVHKEDLIREGQMDTLLQGGKTDAIHLEIMFQGVAMELDATLQIIEQDGKPIIEIVGITPPEPMADFDSEDFDSELM